MDFDLRTPLHYAAKEARLLAVSYLMGIASNPNHKDRYGNTALDLALQGGTLYHKCVLYNFIISYNYFSKRLFSLQVLRSSYKRLGWKHWKLWPDSRCVSFAGRSGVNKP